jgi:hypothetical protein
LTAWLCRHLKTSLESCPECGRRVTLWTWERITPRRLIVARPPELRADGWAAKKLAEVVANGERSAQVDAFEVLTGKRPDQANA